MKSSHSIKMVNIFFLVLALSFSYKSFAGLIDFETTANGSTPFDNGIINIDDTFMADGVSVKFGFDTNGDGEIDSHGVFESVGGGKEGGNSGFMSSYGNSIRSNARCCQILCNKARCFQILCAKARRC